MERLNRLARRTKGYAKSVETLVKLLAPVFCVNLKFNATQPLECRKPNGIAYPAQR